MSTIVIYIHQSPEAAVSLESLVPALGSFLDTYGGKTSQLSLRTGTRLEKGEPRYALAMISLEYDIDGPLEAELRGLYRYMNDRKTHVFKSVVGFEIDVMPRGSV